VRTAQLMFDVGVGVIRCPGVVHRDPTEPAEDSGLSCIIAV
jgi:hypothetical protein